MVHSKLNSVEEPRVQTPSPPLPPYCSPISVPVVERLGPSSAQSCCFASCHSFLCCCSSIIAPPSKKACPHPKHTPQPTVCLHFYSFCVTSLAGEPRSHHTLLPPSHLAHLTRPTRFTRKAQLALPVTHLSHSCGAGHKPPPPACSTFISVLTFVLGSSSLYNTLRTIAHPSSKFFSAWHLREYSGQRPLPNTDPPLLSIHGICVLSCL